MTVLTIKDLLKKHHVITVSLISIVIVVLLLGIMVSIQIRPILRWLGSYLMVRSPMPDSFDVIMSFAGDRSTRDKYALTLLEKYPGVIWILSGRNKDEYLAKLVRAGVDTSKIIFVDSCKNTLEEVRFLKCFLKNNNDLFKIGLVSGPQHMRRIKLFANAFIKNRVKNKNYELLYMPTPFSFYHLPENAWKEWWREKGMRASFIREWTKIVAYYPVIVIKKLLFSK